MSRIETDFSGIALRIDGLGEALAARLAVDWAAFLAAPSRDAWMRVAVSFLDREAPPGPFLPKLMEGALEPTGARFTLPEGEAEVGVDGEARIGLARGVESTVYFAMMNLLRACLAWSLPSRHAAFLHAAGLVVEGRAYVLVGPEGSGKSTWVAQGERGGARVVSDDVVLVEGGADGLEVLGSPFRSTHRADYRPGRWPLAGILFPRHGERPAWADCSPLIARARIAANLPFVSSALERDARVAAIVELLAGGVPCRELTFAVDPSFVDLLAGEGSRGG